MNARIIGLGTALPKFSVTQAISAEMSAPLCCTTDEELRLFEVLYRRSRVRSRYSVLLEKAAGLGDDSGNGNGHGHGEVDGIGTVRRATVNSDGNDLTQSFFNPTRDAADRGPGTGDRMTRYAETAPRLAHNACASALRAASTDPAAIDHLITVSCTGFAAPGIDAALISSLGLPRDVTRTNVGFMGCHGAFNGLRVASALAREKPGSRALVCAVELCSLHFAYGWDPQRIVANSLFADGAAAALIESGAETNAPPWSLAANGSCLMPDSTDAMTWHITDHGFEMTLSPRVPDIIKAHLRPWLETWLARHGLALGRIGSWAVHPGGPRILAAVESALSLPDSALAESHAVLGECGNMSSPTILFILDRLRQRDAARPCVALGFGPGLAVEAMLLL